ncbi:MAG TPA: hypothetical protein VN442_17890 [Bryobacteraceae bacterium]|nr:hypothetical protein [Bryobacteraceae bacterium]
MSAKRRQPPRPESASIDHAEPRQAVTVESMLCVLERMAAAAGIDSPEALDAFYDSVSEEQFERAQAAWIATGPRAHAQHLAYQAMLDARSDQEAESLARRALELDPQCVDAMVVLAELTAEDRVGEFITRVEEAVETARRCLPADWVWWQFEAQPYLRARHRLADALRVLGRADEARLHFEALLEADAEDHRRVREPLLCCYLVQEDLESARALLDRFDGDASAVFPWGRVLERLLAGCPDAAEAALRPARRQNRYVEPYLAFNQAPPASKPERYEPGSREEAVHCVYILGPAWAAHSDAILWLRSQSHHRRGRS